MKEKKQDKGVRFAMPMMLAGFGFIPVLFVGMIILLFLTANFGWIGTSIGAIVIAYILLRIGPKNLKGAFRKQG